MSAVNRRKLRKPKNGVKRTRLNKIEKAKIKTERSTCFIKSVKIKTDEESTEVLKGGRQSGHSEIEAKKQKALKKRKQELKGGHQSVQNGIEEVHDSPSKKQKGLKKRKQKLKSGHQSGQNGIEEVHESPAQKQKGLKKRKQELKGGHVSVQNRIEEVHEPPAKMQKGLKKSKQKLKGGHQSGQNRSEEVQESPAKKQKGLKKRKREVKGGHKSGQNGIKEVQESPAKKQKRLKKRKQKLDHSKEVKEDSTSQTKKDCLNFRAGFFWNATMDQLPVLLKHKQDESSGEDEEVPVEHNKKKKKLTKAERRELIRQEEEQIRKKEERLLNAETNPQSADDFDRLVMSAPNNSKNWIRYMAFHIEATEIPKARAVAQRALQTISFREEQEKLNVWLALLNLENLFGTRETLEQTLQEAVNLNDPYKVHMQVITMFSSTKKIQELDQLVRYILKKYKEKKEMWLHIGTAYIKCGEVEKSRQMMQKALVSLEKKHHVEILSRFALLESEYGELARAETIMENILTSYPKRIDVWNVYIDMLVKLKKYDAARHVLDRAIIQKLPPLKMKSLFKKYLSFENEHGTPRGIESVKTMARKYVEGCS